MDSDNQLLTYVDAGQIAGVSHSTISKWVAAWMLTAVQMPDSRRRRIRRKALIAFLDSLSDSESSATSAT